MLKSDYIRLPVKGCRKINHFKSLGYDITKEFIDVKVDHLRSGSRQIIDVICDFCSNESSVTYKEYFRNVSIGNKYACSKKCGSEKAKETNLANIGFVSHMCLEETQAKSRETNLKIRGVEYPHQSAEVRDKSKKTIIEKYGVDHISKSDYFKAKFKESCLKNNGVEYPMQSIDILEKSKSTLMKNYNVDNPSKSIIIRERVKGSNLSRWGNENYMKTDDFKNKSRQSLFKSIEENPFFMEECKDRAKKTSMEKYGVDYPMQSSIVRNKCKLTLMEKYGVENLMQNNEIRNKAMDSFFIKYGDREYMKTDDFKNKSKISMIEKWESSNPSTSEKYRKENFNVCGENYIEYVGGGISKYRCDSGHDYCISSDNFYQRSIMNVPLCTVCYPISSLISTKEKEIFEFIRSIYTKEIIQSYRDGMEIDIYLPDLKLGFEFNGLYWHSEEYVDKNYHLNKTNYFKERGIRIIHIWEDDWDFKKEILKSQIRNWIGLSGTKIGARSLIISNISSLESKDFLNANHIQGSARSVIRLALLKEGEIISIMTFDKNEGRKKMRIGEWNLSRFCSKINTIINGGMSKLLDFFIKKYNPSRIISYADKSWSMGDSYLNIGFDIVRDTGPDYKYVINRIRKHKGNYRRGNLGAINETESQYMAKIGPRIWDCGKLKFEMLFDSI